MSIKTTTCTSIECDECGDGFADEDYGTPHFTSTDEAFKQLSESYGWTMTATEQVCRACATERLCKAEGHQWGSWRNGARSFTGTRSRWCERDYCCAIETEPIPSKFPQVGGPR